jgi:phage terminase large subunit
VSNLIQIPQKILDAFQKCITGIIYYLILYGGRGSGKSQSIARILLYEASKNKLRILCCREVQNSIKDSVHTLLKDIINENDYYQQFYRITENEIIGTNGSQFIFRGLKKETAGSIKSLEGVNICWVEEAQYISRFSLDILIPTIRNDNSLVIFSMNPFNQDDPVYVDYVLSERLDLIKCECNFTENPFITKKLLNDMNWDKTHDMDKFNHIWMGKTVKHSDTQIFKGRWIVDDFITPGYVDFYHGIDWGFANDPNVLIRCYIDKKTLWIDQEIYQVNMQLENIPEEFNKIDTFRKWGAIADNARPETIAFMNNKGYSIRPCTKWAGCIEDRIEIVKGSFDQIVIHSRCKNTIFEFMNYSYKTDRLTGKILPIIVDKHNHCIDAIFYALDDIIINYGQTLLISDVKINIEDETDSRYVIREKEFQY